MSVRDEAIPCLMHARSEDPEGNGPVEAVLPSTLLVYLCRECNDIHVSVEHANINLKLTSEAVEKLVRKLHNPDTLEALRALHESEGKAKN